MKSVAWILFLFFACTAIASSADLQIFVNNAPLEARPVMKNQILYLPLLPLARKLKGFQILYDSTRKVVSVLKEQKEGSAQPRLFKEIIVENGAPFVPAKKFALFLGILYKENPGLRSIDLYTFAPKPALPPQKAAPPSSDSGESPGSVVQKLQTSLDIGLIQGTPESAPAYSGTVSVLNPSPHSVKNLFVVLHFPDPDGKDIHTLSWTVNDLPPEHYVKKEFHQEKFWSGATGNPFVTVSTKE